MSDELIDRLKAARPPIADGLLEPNPQLLEEILMEPTDEYGFAPAGATRPRRGPHPRRLLLGAAAAAAAVIGIAVTLPDTTPLKAASPTTIKHVVSVNMQPIAESTSAALTSGVAHMTYSSDNGHFIHDSGELTVQFTGENRSSEGRQNADDPCVDESLPAASQEHCDARGNAGFTFANKVVDGRFYLNNGTATAPDWLEDTNEHITGSDLFSADPRNLLTGAAQEADFTDVGKATVDGVSTRHLTATKLDRVPTLNLGLGPIQDDQTKVTKFDVWVDAQNVVRRLDIDTSQTTTGRPGARAILKKNADGTTTKEIDPNDTTPEVTRTQVNKYSVVFTQIGSDITIEAPAHSRKVAGKG